MPYIVTTKRQVEEYHRVNAPATSEVVVSRRAVATLELARRECWCIAPDPVPDKAKFAINALPESGGTVGALPDGTVIEVERATYPDVALLGAFTDSDMRSLENSTTALLAAFNAREAGQCRS